MRRRYHRLQFLRLAGLTALAALVSLGGLFSFFGSAGFLAPVTALADSSRGQTAVAEPGLFFRSTDKAFYSIGENTSAQGPILENQSANAPCFQYGTNAQGDSGPDGKKNRAAVDRFGNFYIASKFASGGVLSVNVDRVSSDCSSSTGYFNLSHMMNPGGERAADPDVAYSLGDKKVYVAMELDPGIAAVYSAPTEDGSGNPLTTGWNSPSRWTLETTFGGQGIRPINVRIAADPTGRVHVISRSSSGKTIAVADKINGSWNTYGGNGKIISSSSDGGWNVTGLAISAARDGTAYATWVSHPGPVSIAMSRFDPVSNTWSFISENIINANFGDYITVTTDSVAAGLDNQSVFIAVGATTNTTVNPATGCIYLYSSSARGNAGSFSRQTINCYSDTPTVVSVAQGDNRVGIIVKDDPNRQNYYYERTGGGVDVTKIKSAVNPLSPAITIPTGQTSISFPVSWHWVSGGTNNSSSGVKYTLQYSVNNGAWQNFGADPTITSSVATFPTTATSATITVDMSAKAYPLNIQFRSLGIDPVNSVYNEDPAQAVPQGITLTYPAITTSMSGLAPTTNANSFSIFWSGNGGKVTTLTYRVDVKDDNGAWNTCIASTTTTTLTYLAGCTAGSYKAISGHTYSFRTSATDGVLSSFNPNAAAQSSTHIALPISGFTASIAPAVAAGNTSTNLTLDGQNGDVNPGSLYGLLTGLKFNIQYMDLTTGGNWTTLPAVQGVADGNGHTHSTPAFSGLQNGHTYKIQVTATDGKTTTLPIELTTTVLSNQPVGTVYNNCTIVRVNVVTDLNNPSGYDHYQLSNNSNGPWSPSTVYDNSQVGILWNLADPQYGGPGLNGFTGTHQVFVRYSTDGGNSFGAANPVTTPQGGTSFNAMTCNIANKVTPLGDTNGTNRDFVSFYNPGPADAGVFLTYYNGSSVVGASDRAYVVKGNGHLTVETIGMSNAHGIVVKSDGSVSVEQHSYNSNGSNGLDAMALNSAPEPDWYFADSVFNGRTISYDIFNPGPGNVDVTLTLVDFLGNTQVVIGNTNIPPGRTTILSSGGFPTTVGAKIHATVAGTNTSANIVAAQTITSGSQYSTSLGQPGSKASTGWYFPVIDATVGNQANMAIWNPNNADITLTFTFYQPNGGPLLRVTRTMGAKRVATYPLGSLLSSAPGLNTTNLRQALLSVSSTQNIYAELVQSNSSGMSALRGTGLANLWKIADSSDGVNVTGNGAVSETLYIANFSSTAANVVISAYDDNGNQVCTSGCSLTIQPYQRATVPVSSLGGVSGKSVSFSIQATGGTNMLAVNHSQSLGGDNFLVEAQP